MTVAIKSPVISARETTATADLQKLREFHAAADKAGGLLTMADLVNMGIITSGGVKK